MLPQSASNKDNAYQIIWNTVLCINKKTAKVEVGEQALGQLKTILDLVDMDQCDKILTGQVIYLG